MFFSSRPNAVALLVALAAIPAAARAESAWHEGFEGSNPTWSDNGGDAQYHVVQHQRLQQDAHSGQGCEWIQIEGNGGSQVYFAHQVGRPRVIEDLTPSVWIKSDRPGIYLALRLVLPRTIDPQSGQPMETVLMGPTYADVGRWQQVQMTRIPALLMQQIHVLRAQTRLPIDSREAYVDAVLLNVYGGSGVTNLWIDDLEVAGHASMSTGPTQPQGPALQPQPPAGALSSRETSPTASAAGPLVPVRLPPVEIEDRTPTIPSAGAPAARHTVNLSRSVLTIDERPMFPRAIQHRGEPLRVLKKLGFNAVWLDHLPAAELLEEAGRLGLWLIGPPSAGPTPATPISPALDAVLAWDLGNELAEGDLESTRRWAEQVRAADRRMNRPLICCPRIDLRGFSRIADFLLIDRRPLGASLPMTDYATWVQRQPLLARPGTPVWTTVQTQPNEALRRQLQAIDPNTPPPLAVPAEQIRLLAYTAVASGSRGLLFLSDSPLDSPDAQTQQRAAALELLNLELALIEPWAAAGSVVATADSNVPEVVGSVFLVGRARLLLPIWSTANSQYAPPQSAANSVSLVVPGVPEACNAYELIPSGARPLRSRRVAGGLCVTLDEFGLTGQVLLAHDRSIVGAVDRRAAELGRREAELQRHLAVLKLNAVQTSSAQLAARVSVAGAAQWLDAARKNLAACDEQLAAGDAPAAAQNARRAGRSLRLLERAYWEAIEKGLPSPMTSPGAVSFDTLPFHFRLVDRLAGARFGPSQIAGGDFEDLQTMLRAGWQYIQHSTPNVQTAVDLAPDAARSGRLGLRLAAAPVDPKNPPVVVETPPALFTSPSVKVEAGQIVCIQGWVRVAEPITGSVDGLLIVDSLGGEALAERISRTEGWQSFVLYRVAPQSGTMAVTFALAGLGEARLDDVTIQVAEGPAVVLQR